MAFSVTLPQLGFPANLANTDAGFTPANTSTAIPSPPMVLGQVVRAFDPTYGEGEFILLRGVASTAIGSLVIWDPTTYQTTLCATTANQSRPVGVAMSASTAALWGWYQIGGSAVVAKSTGVKVLPSVSVGVNSTGKIGNTASGKEILGAKSSTATAASAATTVVVVLDRPHLQGRVS
jgi:hypothetical protein